MSCEQAAAVLFLEISSIIEILVYTLYQRTKYYETTDDTLETTYKIDKIRMIILAPGKRMNIINYGCQVNLNFDFCEIIAVYRQLRVGLFLKILAGSMKFSKGQIDAG